MVAFWEHVAGPFHHGFGGAGFVLRADVPLPAAGGIRGLQMDCCRTGARLALWLLGTFGTKKMLVFKNEPRMLFKISEKIRN